MMTNGMMGGGLMMWGMGLIWLLVVLLLVLGDVTVEPGTDLATKNCLFVRTP
jgi:hypothetical protein